MWFVDAILYTQKSCGSTFLPGLAELIWFIYILDLID